MSRALRVVLTLVLCLGQFAFAPHASADALKSCRIQASVGQTVSLGFPVRPERLVNFVKAKILVIPFKLKDNSSYSFTDEYKRDYQTAASNIKEFSGGKASVEYVFAPTVITELTNADMDQLKINQQQQWQQDETKSTWGFVRKFIADQDTQIDYTGINAVILEGSSTSSKSDIAEAMMFYQTPVVPWFRHIQTAEGSISNVVLLDNHSSQQTITHEIMHLYGLTDLYGTSTGPGRFSLMASNELGLLTYEKWVLGWHSDTDVKCLENVTTSSISQITFDYSKPNQLAVIRATSGSIYIVETTKVGSQKYLVFYSLDNEARPPLIFYQKNTRTDLPGVLIDSSSAIGAQFASTEFTLLISDLNSSTITMNLVSSSLTSTAQFSEIVAKASEAKSKQDADAKTAAELKAKQEADAKAAAELKAKQDADAKAAAELKVKQEADAKVAADIKAKQDADASARAATAKKKTTITCIKGKTLKKVTAVQPKCPIGYKKR
jgi:hypothetical protein